MNEYRGSCSCGCVSISIRLPRQIEDYRPRICDCDFCVARGAGYLSDPYGTVQARSGRDWAKARQGSELAEFFSCPDCSDLAFVAYAAQSRLTCAVNTNMLSARGRLGPAVEASPKQLSPSEKLVRWQQLWTPLVIVASASG